MKETDNIANSVTMTLFADMEGECTIHNCLTGSMSPIIVTVSLKRTTRYCLQLNVPILMVANIYPKKKIATINPCIFEDAQDLTILEREVM